MNVMTNLTAVFVNTTIKGLLHLLCCIDAEQLPQVPENGPLILVCNHINFLEIPLLYTHLLPRPLTGFAKRETWDNPALAYLFDLWQAIPLRRGKPDLTAFRQGLEALQEGKILAISPEGTRSGHGRLGPGYPGVVTIGLQSGAPILPVAYYGGELFWDNLTHLRRTDFHIAVGCPFYLQTGEMKVTRKIRREMTDEIMYQLAALLPPDYRGHYQDLSSATENYLRFPSTSRSNLELALGR